MAQVDYSAAIEAINKAQNVLVLPSSPPDGDSIGSALALYLALQKKGKKVTVVAADPVPDAYKFLPDSQEVESDYSFGKDFIITLNIAQSGFKDLQYEVKDHKVNIIITPENGEIRPEDLSINQDASKFDLIITVDTAEVKQLGKVYQANQDLFQKLPVVNIDHHPSNTKFGSTNIVNPDKASTTLMLTELFQQWDMTVIDSDVATLLLAGLITDTGSFQHTNTTPEAFDVAALLIGLGARQQEIIRHIYKTKELHTLRLWGRVLSNIKTDYDHKLVWSTVTNQDFLDTNSKSDDIGDIIDELLSNAPEAEVVVLFKEIEDAIHLSIRTTTDEVNASRIAQHFGGGGHRRAAGANVGGKEFNAVVEEVLDFIKTEQQKRFNREEPAVSPEPLQIEQPVATPAVEPVVSFAEPQVSMEANQPEPMNKLEEANSSTQFVTAMEQMTPEQKNESFELNIAEPVAQPEPQIAQPIAPELEPTPTIQPEPIVSTPAPQPVEQITNEQLPVPTVVTPTHMTPAEPVIDPYANPTLHGTGPTELDTYIKPDPSFNESMGAPEGVYIEPYDGPTAPVPEEALRVNIDSTPPAPNPADDMDDFSEYLRKQ